MATPLTPSLLNQTASKGPFKGLKRTTIIQKKIKAGLPFTLVDGVRIKFKSYSAPRKVFTDMRGVWEYPLNQIVKDEDFGGAPAKKETAKLQLGGTITEGLSEGFFCVYLALLTVNKMASFHPSELKSKSGAFTLQKFRSWCQSKGIGKMLRYALEDTQFTKETKHYYEYLMTKSGNKTMDDIFKAQATAFKGARNVALSKSFYLMRQGQLKDTGADPYQVFGKLSSKIKQDFSLSSAPKDDKWNPADVWMLNGAAITALKKCSSLADRKASAPGPYKVAVLNDLNTCVQDQWELKNLYPISLKLPGGSVHVTLENDKSPGGLAKVVRYEKFKLANSNQDIQIFFAIDYVNIHTRKMVEKDAFKLKLKTKTRSGGFRFEIEGQSGGGARYGTVGMGSQEYIVSNTAPGGVAKLNKFRNKYQSLIDEKILDTSNASEWINVDEMSKRFKENKKKFQTNIQPYFEDLFKLLGEGSTPTKKDAEFYLNKTHAAEIGYLMNSITSNLVKSEVVQNIYDIANSQRFAVGVDLKKVKQHQKTTGGGKLEEIDPTNKTAYKVLFESSFHYVVK